MVENPKSAFSQCPSIHHFIGKWLRYAKTMANMLTTRVDNTFFEECYETYIKAVQDCLGSDDGKLDQSWGQVFSEQPIVEIS